MYRRARQPDTPHAAVSARCGNKPFDAAVHDLVTAIP
jgi:hypothetical protein